MNFEVILFDLDGTLVNSMPLIRKSYQMVFSEMDIPWDDVYMANMSTLPLKETAKIYAEQRLNEFLASFRKHYLREHNNLMKIFPGTREMLELLKKHGCRLGIVTSKTRTGTITCLDFVGLTNLMDVIITTDDAANHKPHPEPLIKAMEVLSVSADDTLFIGDSTLDIIAAKAAGIRAAFVPWGAGNPEVIQGYKPDYVLEDWSQLTDLVLSI